MANNRGFEPKTIAEILAERKSEKVYVYLSASFLEAVLQAAKRRNLSVTAYVSDCLIKDLSAQGLVK